MISNPAVEAGRSNPDYRESLQTSVNSEKVTVIIYPDIMELFLCIADDIVAIGASKEDRPHALVISSRPEVKDWAEETFKKYRQQATRLSSYAL